ncbi:transposase DNA-binding-containing protein [Paraburkholderia sp. JHI2823]|uniref:IS4/Tn5 family transposase DNA-binding protein n=1 Tax=Paraburkholderia sp. JHI2823 TaxID=3112960 RepID=UPI003172C77C
MARELNGWAYKELDGVNLGDTRRNQRAKAVLTRLAERPTASIPGACLRQIKFRALYAGCFRICV